MNRFSCLILIGLSLATTPASSSAYNPPGAAARLQLGIAGAAPNDFFGYSVSTAGDVNGDGFADVIVGAVGNDAGGDFAGRAYVYYGGPAADAIADFTLTGAAAADQFGNSVSTAGDVNGDGYADVIVGAPGNDAGGADAGRAYVYYGGPGADAIADLILTGAGATNAFGTSVSTAGDVNGDGYSDVIVGAYLNSAGGAQAGRAYVYYGGTAPDATADLTLTGAAAGDLFGISVSTAGDVNGDHYADVIVGAYQNSAGGAQAGRAYVYYGGAAPNAIADLTLTGAAGDFFGHSVSTAGDVNGDGYADVMVGADQSSAGGLPVGRAYVFYGGPGADAVADLILTGAEAGAEFGSSVSTAGDVNGDGYADAIVGAHFGNAATGRAYLFYGGPGVDALADFIFTGVAFGDQFGASVSTAGDVNGDGYDDVIVGAFENASIPGHAYAYDMNRYHLLSPNGGETWNVGAMKTISWLGAEPADLWLSSDGGYTYRLQLARIGGNATNSVPLRVPHLPTKFARVRLTPGDPNIAGRDQSDSTFTIQASISLLALLAAPAPNGASGVVISWQSDPGPEDLEGYRLERASPQGNWRTVVSLTREMAVTDPEGGAGSRYRLFAVNGFGEELWLGETSLRPAVPLAAWPLPYRGGNLSISFATVGGLGGGVGPTEVVVFDISGRLVRTVERREFAAGYQSTAWDGRDDRGRQVPTGVYFLRAHGASGDKHSVKIAVLR